MIRVFHGQDEFSIEEAVARVRESVGPPEVRDPNTTVFEGSFQMGALVAAASAMPFLADRRLVLVRGLLIRLDNNDKTLGDEWDSLPKRFEDIPATSEVLFVEVEVESQSPRPGGRGLRSESKKLKLGGRGLRAAGPRAEVREFQPPRGAALDAWVRDRFAVAGAQANGDAIARLAWLAGGNLRLLDQEVRKLALYAAGRPVTHQDVGLMVADAREESIFAAVDAILERKPGVAMRLLYSLLGGGATAAEIINMLARQVRLVLLARELHSASVPIEEMGRRIGVTNRFALEKTLRQAERFSPVYLASVHRRLLSADLAIKTGELDERLAVELLVARLAA